MTPLNLRPADKQETVRSKVEDATAAFVKRGRISHGGKIWIDTIESGADALQQIRDFFITADVFESPSMEAMLRKALAMYFTELMVFKGRRPGSFDYVAYTYIITQALGAAFDPCFVPEAGAAETKQNLDRVMRATAEDMGESLARVIDGEAVADVALLLETAAGSDLSTSRKRKAEDTCANDSRLDDTNVPDLKRSKGNVAADDTEIEDIVAGSNDRQGPGNIALPSSVRISTAPLADDEQGNVKNHEVNSNVEHSSDKVDSAAAEVGAATSPAPVEPSPAAVENTSSLADNNDGAQLPAARATSNISPPADNTVLPVLLPPLNHHLSSLRDAYLRLLWTHRFDLLNNTDFLLYLAAHPHLSAALLGHVRARGGLRAQRLPKGNKDHDPRSSSSSSSSGSSNPPEEEKDDDESIISCRQAHALLNCAEWLAWAPGDEGRMRAFWVGLARRGGLGGYYHDLGSEKAARRGEGRCREAPY